MVQGWDNDDVMVMGGSDMQNTCKCCATHPRQQSTNVDSLGRSGLVQLLRLAAKKHDDTTMMKQCHQSNVDDDGDDGDGGDGDGNGNSNGNDAAAAANGNDVDDDDGSNSRMAIGQRQLDNGNGTTMM